MSRPETPACRRSARTVSRSRSGSGPGPCRCPARMEWSDRVRLDTGVRVATTRRLGPVTLTVTELAAARDLAGLVPGDDPFAPMFDPR